MLEKFLALRAAAGGKGGASSWNDLKDKPFGDVPTQYDVIWDGDTEGRFVMDLAGVGFEGFYAVKVSDKVYTENELSEKYIESNLNEGWFSLISESYYLDTSVPGLISVCDREGIFVIVVHSASETNAAFGTPDGHITNGTYFISVPQYGYWTRGLVSEIGYLKRLEEKYLPILTSPSGKKFKLSVDDSGAVTATEV